MDNQPATLLYRLDIDLAGHNLSMLEQINSISHSCKFNRRDVSFFFSSAEKAFAITAKLILTRYTFKLAQLDQEYILVQAVGNDRPIYSLENLKNAFQSDYRINQVIFKYYAQTLPAIAELDVLNWLGELPQSVSAMFNLMGIEELQLVEPFVRHFREKHMGSLSSHIQKHVTSAEYEIWIRRTSIRTLSL